MKKEHSKSRADELLPEYDFAAMKGGVRGKYARRFKSGTNLVRLDPEIARAFGDEHAVNDALRSLLRLARTRVRTAH